ncbi:MAG: hypothetical protein JO033_10915 [Acidobacteriaceae bacterium]|nr:hypothetical protein [Acidobacteriaceae bacterium]MBV9499328.1 hypothetical protein [Acidobacteriaceae bacterium]
MFESTALEGRVSVDLDDIESYSIKGTVLPMDTKIAKGLTRQCLSLAMRSSFRNNDEQGVTRVGGKR